MKNTNKVRLTESQLHNVIKKCVNEAINKIKFGGKSFHGNNPNMIIVRVYRKDNSGYDDETYSTLKRAEEMVGLYELFGFRAEIINN